MNIIKMNEIKTYQNLKMDAVKSFRVNDYATLKLEGDKTPTSNKYGSRSIGKNYKSLIFI